MMGAGDGLAGVRSRLDALAQASLPDTDPFYIYGAGQFGRGVARELRRLGREVRGFIDVQADQLGTVDGLPCLHPSVLTDAQARGAACIHATMNAYVCTREVADWEERRRFASVVFPPALYGIPGFSLTNFWLDRPARTIRDWDSVAWLHARLEDEASRRTLEQLLHYRLSGDPRLHPGTDAEDTYSPDFLPIRDRALTFIDGGAYTGDSLEALLARGARVRNWVAFEPDRGTMARLIETARRHRACVAQYTLIPAGLSDRNATVRFADAKGLSSHIVSAGSDDGTCTVEVVRLDDILRLSDEAGTIYVKLDVEGEEPAALRGMTGLFQRKPVLAVSLYHAADHLWTIPQLIDAQYPGVRLRIRQHLHNGFETVLYAMPGPE